MLHLKRIIVDRLPPAAGFFGILGDATEQRPPGPPTSCPSQEQFVASFRTGKTRP